MTTTDTKGGPVGDDQIPPTGDSGDTTDVNDTGETGEAGEAGEAGDTLVADIMERDVVTIGPDATVHELVQLLQEKDLGGVPVVDPDVRLIGIVTEGDLVIEDADVRLPHYFGLFGNLVYLGGQKKFEERLKKMVGNAVRDVMTSHVFTVAPDEPASAAANIMVDHKVNRVPVVEDDKLVGIVARHDIIKLLGL